MIDSTAFHSLSYGLYIIGAQAGDKRAGCVVNTFQQVTSSPLQVSVALNKENATTAVIQEAGRFTASCLSEDATMELIGTFGFHCSADRDKFAECAFNCDEAGVPYVADQCAARFSARVVQTLDVGSHILFVGEVEEAERVCDGQPMTYAYYHQVKGGKTPPKASSYLPDEAKAAPAPTEDADAPKPKYAWRCTVCGHMEYVDELPDDFICPVCGVGKDMFERVEV
ncbi:flavin reductase [Eggerthella sp. YY7918]|uniref:flavin reductase n=1 Tax=Eggerthella sp. (strain YY7918) TaxID=502558 RepID=UPI0002171344|nr:flavin reductase [Eggerthella sp. YY7918]BAK44236.1 conserved protein [Eggerthella sp. YY7918]